MLFTNWNNKLLTFAMVFVGLITLVPLEGSAFPSSLIQTINTWQWSPPSPDSAGIVYLPASDRLLVSDSEVNEMPIFTGDNLFEATLTGNLMNTLTTVSFSDEPTGVTLNPSNGHLFYSDDTGTKSIYEMNPGPDGQYDTSDDIITSFKTSDFGSNDPEGVTFVSGLGALFIADGINEEVYQVTPGANGIFDGVPPAGDDQVTSFDTTSLGVLDPEGIAFNSHNGNLYIVGKPADTLFEVTIGGALVQTIDISAANARKPAGLAYAPSSLNPNTMNIYIAARGVDNDSNPNENDGKVYEMTLPTSTNHPPVANDDSANTPEDTPVIIDVASNDNDPNGNLDPASANSTCANGSTGCNGAANGSLIDNGDGAITYTPNSGFTGSDSFVYEICDSELLCDTATADITVTLSNDPPVAFDDNANTSEDTPVIIDVAANDTDADGNLNPASANSTCANGSTGCNGAANGSLTDHGNGTITYTPDPSFNGSDSFIYEICDTLGACDTATANIFINPVNDPPVANDDSANTPEDTLVTIDVAANDSDPDGNLDPASANSTCANGSTGCNGAANGSLIDNGDGTITYTPNSGFTGSDSFVYEICDSELLCDTATADITVTLSNDPPVAVDDNANTDEDTAVIIDVAANDSDPDINLDPNSANSSCTNGSTGCNGAVNGSLTDNGDGTITYNPDPGFGGFDSFVYEICDMLGACDTATVNVTINSVNDPPVAVDDSDSTDEDTAVIIDVAANDSDPDGNLDPASAHTACGTCADPANGSLINYSDGTFDYTPAIGFTGDDSFVYEICDTEMLCDTAMATITVYPAAPMTIEVRVTASTDDAEEKASGGMRLTSSDLEFVFDKGDQTVGMRFNGVAVPQGAPVTSAYLQFQVDEVNTEATNLSIQGQASDAPVTFTASTGNVSNRPRTVAAVSWAPAPWTTKGEAGPGQQTPDISAIIQEIVDRPGWTSGNSLVIIITGTGERTAESFDGTPTAAPLLHVEFSGGGQSNNPPVANDDSANTTVDTPLTMDVAANDTDPDGNLNPASANSTCATCFEPVNGFLVNQGDGTFDYTPDPDFTGPDDFVYEICDTELLCDTATADIMVTISNDPPVAVDDNANTSEDTPVTIDVATNDSDPDGNLDPASANTTCAICVNPANGSLLNNGDGTFSYTPDPDFNGADSFVYEICDTIGVCDWATASITIDPVADPPVAVDDNANTSEDTPVTIDVAANDSDADGNLYPASANTTCATCAYPSNGSLINYSDGTFDYTPDPGFTGDDSFVYEICDTEPLCDTAMANITVYPAAPMTIEVRVTASTDDAEEKASGGMRLTSSDLELVYDKGVQTVGMRFNGVAVPQGAPVTSAYLQFQVDEVNTEATNLSIQGQASDAPVTFTASSGNVSNRPRTVAAVSWAPAPWTTKGEAGPGQQTPDISAIIQEIVDRPGWTSGNSLVIIITGSGERTAESFDGTPAAAPLLHVEFSSGN